MGALRTLPTQVSTFVLGDVMPAECQAGDIKGAGVTQPPLLFLNGGRIKSYSHDSGVFAARVYGPGEGCRKLRSE